VLFEIFRSPNVEMTESIHLNDVREPIPLEKRALTKEVGSADAEISSDSLSVEGLGITLEHGVQKHDREEAAAAKEYIAPLATWRLLTIVFGYV